jgi:hypothetical protein
LVFRCGPVEGSVVSPQNKRRDCAATQAAGRSRRFVFMVKPAEERWSIAIPGERLKNQVIV